MCKENAKNLMYTGCEEHRVQETPPCLKETQLHNVGRGGEGEQQHNGRKVWIIRAKIVTLI
jgi:hypothetical protein